MIDIDELNAEADKAIATATSEGEFDALAYFSNATLPEDTAVLYQDSAAAYALAEIARKVEEQKAQDEADDDEVTDITQETYHVDEDEVAELKRRLNASAVTFKVRGLAPAARDAIEKKARASNPYVEGEENRAYNEDYNGNLIAKSIVSVTNAKGQRDNRPWDKDRVAAFNTGTEPSEWIKLFEAVFKVNFLGDAIDRAVNADF